MWYVVSMHLMTHCLVICGFGERTFNDPLFGDYIFDERTFNDLLFGDM